MGPWPSQPPMWSQVLGQEHVDFPGTLLAEGRQLSGHSRHRCPWILAWPLGTWTLGVLVHRVVGRQCVLCRRGGVTSHTWGGLIHTHPPPAWQPGPEDWEMRMKQLATAVAVIYSPGRKLRTWQLASLFGVSGTERTFRAHFKGGNTLRKAGGAQQVSPLP